MKACLLLLCLLTVPLEAATVGLQWDAHDAGATPAGYRILYGTSSGVYTTTVDLPLVTAASVTVPLDNTTYYFVLVAYDRLGINGADRVSGYSNEVQVTTPPGQTGDPRCAPPLGNRAISITPTGLYLTGSKGPGSRAHVDYLLASPNSPVTRVSVTVNNVPMGSPQIGENLGDFGSLWFVVPAFSGPIRIQATNAYGCSRDQSTLFSVVAP